MSTTQIHAPHFVSLTKTASQSSHGSRPGSGHGAGALISSPTYINYKGLCFLIVDAPSNNNLPIYLKEFRNYNVKDVVRCCEPTYTKAPLEAQGIEVHDCVFGDGDAPPAAIVNEWLNLIENRFAGRKEGDQGTPACVAIHCVAGLGRAPVLVAIALIEEGMNPLDAVLYIRERRRGAINNKQLKFIENYKRKKKSGGCVIC